MGGGGETGDTAGGNGKRKGKVGQSCQKLVLLDGKENEVDLEKKKKLQPSRNHRGRENHDVGTF